MLSELIWGAEVDKSVKVDEVGELVWDLQGGGVRWVLKHPAVGGRLVEEVWELSKNGSVVRATKGIHLRTMPVEVGIPLESAQRGDFICEAGIDGIGSTYLGWILEVEQDANAYVPQIVVMAIEGGVRLESWVPKGDVALVRPLGRILGGKGEVGEQIALNCFQRRLAQERCEAKAYGREVKNEDAFRLMVLLKELRIAVSGKREKLQ